jgi:hypothetical protein
MLLSSPPTLLRHALTTSTSTQTARLFPSRRAALTSAMPPKRKVAAKAEATDAPKKVKAEPKGLAVGAQFPDIGPLETDEGKMVDLKV